MNTRNWAGRFVAVWAILWLGFLLAGCKTANHTPESSSSAAEFSAVPGGPPPTEVTHAPVRETGPVRETAPVRETVPSPQTARDNVPPAREHPPVQSVAPVTDVGVPIISPDSHTAGSVGTSTQILKAEDLLTITFADLPIQVMPFEGRIKEDGTVTLILNQTFMAAGKTAGTLEKEIRERYVPKYFKYMTVTVKVAEGSRFYYVGGEVKSPGSKPYVARINILEAIQSAGDFSEYARRSGVVLYRAGKKIPVDCKKAKTKPELNIEVLPNDRIEVPKSLF